MKTLKKILIGLLIIIAVPLVGALFIKKDYKVVREITIRKPTETVFGYVRMLRNQDQYNKWAMADPKAKKDYRGQDGEEGFVYAWDSKEKKSGAGEQKIVKIIPNQRIDFGLHFIRPFEGDAVSYLNTSPSSPTETKLQWGMEGRSKYPMNIMNLFMDKMLGDDIQESLQNIKNNLENNSSISKN